jgi:hypothetical protein
LTETGNNLRSPKRSSAAQRQGPNAAQPGESWKKAVGPQIDAPVVGMTTQTLIPDLPAARVPFLGVVPDASRSSVAGTDRSCAVDSDQDEAVGADDGDGQQRFDERTASRHLIPGAIDGRTMGREVHRLIADLVSAGIRRPTPRQLRAHVAGHPLVSDARIVYRQAAKQRLLVATALYFRFFVPPTAWRLLGTEVTLGNSRLDLVWRNGEEVIADEIKSGRVVDRFERDQLEQQIDRALANAIDRYGDAFAGLRVLFLTAPTKSFVLRGDGNREQFVWGDS